MITSKQINSTEFPRLKRLMRDPAYIKQRIAELDDRLSGEYIGGMTEFWQRQRDFLLTEKGQELMDVLDGSEQECYLANPFHGGKITCHKCKRFISEEDSIPYLDHQHPDDFPRAHFHKGCFNPYEHYYGLDKPID